MSNCVLPKSVFIHIPKTGGTAIQNVLYRLGLVKYRYEEPNYGHLELWQMPQDVESYYWAFVRHPYTWYPSYYLWNKRHWNNMPDDFEGWCGGGHYTKLVKAYLGVEPACKLKVDFVGKLENVATDLKQVLRRERKYGLRTKAFLAAVDANRQDYERGISDECKRLIYAGDRWLFDHFEYSP